jgi:predicted phage terminase large subunit-like protein
LLALGATRLDVFVRLAFYAVEGHNLISEPYLESICFELQELIEGRCPRLLVNMPPRHLKSFCIAIALPAFALGHDPSLDIVVATYNQELGREHTAKFLRLLNSSFYRACFPGVRLSETRLENIRTTRGGGRRPVTVGGGLTGMGADILVLDDLIKAQDVEYGPLREETMRFYRETALTRLNDQRTGRIVVAQQRLHAYDISADLIESGVYRHLSLASIAPRDQVLQLYNARTFTLRAGELLSPRRFPQDVLDRLRLEMGTAAFSAQFLQDPLPPGSMLLDTRRLHWVDQPCERTSLQYVVQSIDTAVSVSDQSDYTVIMTFGWNGERWFILNIVRERLDFSLLKQAVIEQARTGQADLILIEDGHIGSALWTEVREAVRQAFTIRPDGSKEERLSASTEALYSGRIAIPLDQPWSSLLRDELRAFPGGRHDDMVDALTQFVDWERGRRIDRLVDQKLGRRPRTERSSTGRPRLF